MVATIINRDIGSKILIWIMYYRRNNFKFNIDHKTENKEDKEREKIYWDR